MGIRKPWIVGSAEAIRSVPAVLGVYEIADRGRVRCCTSGRLGGGSRLGCDRGWSCIFGGADANPVLRERAHSFRWESNQQYTTKRLEMLMQFQRDERVDWPRGNAAGDWQDQPQLGRLRRSDDRRAGTEGD